MVVWRAGLSAVCRGGILLGNWNRLLPGSPHPRQISPDCRSVLTSHICNPIRHIVGLLILDIYLQIVG